MTRIPIVRCASTDLHVDDLVLEKRWLLPDRWRLYWHLQSDPNVAGSTTFLSGCTTHQITVNGRAVAFAIAWRSNLRRALLSRPERQVQGQEQSEFVTPASVLCLAEPPLVREFVDAG